MGDTEYITYSTPENEQKYQDIWTKFKLSLQ